MRQPDDDVLLRDMRDYAVRAITAAKSRRRSDLDDDDVFAAAMERFIEIVGEAASKISDTTRHAMTSVPWLEVVGMRNRLVHGYASVDHDVVWAVVTSDLPALGDVSSAARPA